MKEQDQLNATPRRPQEIINNSRQKLLTESRFTVGRDDHDGNEDEIPKEARKIKERLERARERDERRLEKEKRQAKAMERIKENVRRHQ